MQFLHERVENIVGEAENAFSPFPTKFFKRPSGLCRKVLMRTVWERVKNSLPHNPDF